MKKIVTILCLLATLPVMAQITDESDYKNVLNSDNERYIEPTYYNMVTLQAGYSLFNNDLGKYGYNISVEYNRYVTRNLYVLGSYIYGYSSNTVKYKDTENTTRGGIQEHIIAVGFGYDMLKINGHRIYGALGVGAGYQDYTYEKVTSEFPFKKMEITEKGWNVAYFPTAGYGYSVVPNVEIGLSWAGYFLRRYWGNSFNVHVGYRF